MPLPAPEPGRANLPLSDCTPSPLGGLDVPVPTDRVLRADCGTLTVPLDPAQPALGTVTLGVVRAGLADVPGRTPLAARPAAARAGRLRHRPDGAAGRPRMAAQVPTYLLGQYAIIGLDRRGAGTDTLDCADPSARSALVDADPATMDTTLLLERARAVVQACNVALDGQLGGFSSEAAADDIEAVRQALGVARLSALGTGDGAAALADWARAHPRAVGRLVLDGPPDPGVDEPARSEARAKATEAAFDAFAQRCTSRSACPLGADPRTAVTALVTSLRAQPLTAPGRAAAHRGHGGDGDPGGARRAVVVGHARRRVAGGPGGRPRAAPQPGSSRPSARAGRYDAALATDCNDAQNRIAPAQIQELARQVADGVPAVREQRRGRPRRVRSVAHRGRPGAGARPARPAAARRDRHGGGSAHRRWTPPGPSAQSLPSAVFIGWQGAATGAFPRTQCVNSLVDNLLVDGQLPDPSTLCPP